MINIRGFDPLTGVWNDSLTGNYMWTNTNIGETLSDVLTPFTWSMISDSFEQMNVLPGHPVVGNIAGRAYNNASVMLTAMSALGKKIEDLNKEMGGVRSEYVQNLPILMIPLPRSSALSILRKGLYMRWMEKRGLRGIPGMLAENRAWCNGMRQRISKIQDKEMLAAICLDELLPYVLGRFWMVIGSAWQYGELVGKLRNELNALVGVDDADKLLSNVSSEADLLASLGPLVGLAKVARGEMDRQTYFDLWGHRGPHESEVSTPRPAEEPGWLEDQLSLLAQAPVDAEELLSRQRAEFEAAWSRFRGCYPRKAKAVRRRLDKTARAARVREAVRSELVRIIWVGRTWALQAGKLTGLGDDIFLMTIEEVTDLLAGDESMVDSIPARRETYEGYKKLPPYPVVIRGQFDPFKWATDPNRRSDFFDSEALIDVFDAEIRRENLILGVPGSAGVVEGTVRRLDSPDNWTDFQNGEILVTVQTNVGWSPLFPLARAVVTDVGAALSHAAIVARELGIPAVVNCGDATMRLKTGDRIRVDGSHGTVEIISGG